jgi:hypothetical protein
MALHWDKLDNWRMNKFLSLIRKQLAVLFTFLQNQKWEVPDEFIKSAMKILFEEAFLGIDLPLGVGMHLADIYLDELASK